MHKTNITSKTIWIRLITINGKELSKGNSNFSLITQLFKYPNVRVPNALNPEAMLKAIPLALP